MSHIHYKIHPEIRTIVEYISGPINLNDLLELRRVLLEEKNFNPLFHIITDFRDSTPFLSETDITVFTEFLRKNNTLLGNRRTALITKTPMQAVATSLYISEINDFPMKVEVFSSVDAAAKWIGLALSDVKIVKQTLKDFKCKV